MSKFDKLVASTQSELLKGLDLTSGKTDGKMTKEKAIRIMLVIIMSLILFSCSKSYHPMNEYERNIVTSVLIHSNNDNINEALEIVDKRICRYKDKDDFYLKVQLLLLDKQFDNCLDETNIIVKRYPDYIEMIVLQSALALYLNKNDAAKKNYDIALSGYEERLTQAHNDYEKYTQLSNMYFLANMFSDVQKENIYLEEIGALNISENDKMIINKLTSSTKSELFEAIGISK